MRISLLLVCWLALIASPAFGHDSTKHKTKKDTTIVQVADSSGMHPGVQTGDTAALGYFPSLHPLVVHIPIMLLVMAAITQLAGFFVFKRELTWTAWVMLIIGFIGAYASSTWFHAHTGVLPPATQQLLEQHELFASYTTWLSGIALLLQSANLFFFKRKTWLTVVASALVISSAVFVALAGHHGAELVHKHGVGPKGTMLEQDHH